MPPTPSPGTSNSSCTAIGRAVSARAAFYYPPHESAFRLFNGFLEGCPGLILDVYGSTLVVFNQADPPGLLEATIQEILAPVRETLPWLDSVLVKTRNSPTSADRRGRLMVGQQIAHKVLEHGVWYALDLMMHQDASLYLDTRNLRKWAFKNLGGRTVLNTFAYTGSLGVAALAGGAARVVQLDLDRPFLALAENSCALNGLPAGRSEFILGDFFAQVGRLKRVGERFDCIFLDPPFFSATSRSRLDMNTDTARLVNKVRPLINDGGSLVVVNNSLYLSGKEYLQILEGLCTDGCLSIAELIPVPDDFTGYASTRAGTPLTDPRPFNHSTKIAVLSVRRKRHPARRPGDVRDARSGRATRLL